MNKIKSNKTPKHLVKRGEKRFGIKSFSLAAIAGLTLFGLQASASDFVEEYQATDGRVRVNAPQGTITGAAADFNPADYVENTYGTGDSSKYFKFEKDTDGHYILSETASDDADFAVKYSSENVQSSINNSIDTSSTDIDGLFTEVSVGSSNGTMINNSGSGKLGNISSNFVNTNTQTYSGRAINNAGSINNITGIFIQNTTNGKSYSSSIYNTNSGTIKDITGEFIANSASGNNVAWGATIAAQGKIGTITSNFIGNSLFGKNTYGAAICSNNGGSSTIEEVNGDFIGNYSIATGSGYGGAIFHDLLNVTNGFNSNFIGNYVKANTNGYGGAIHGNKTDKFEINNGEFISNFVEANTGEAQGGAISGGITLNALEKDVVFDSNYVSSKSGTASGGAIYSSRVTTSYRDGNIVFKNNYAKSENSIAGGGALYILSGTVDKLKGSFIENYAQSSGGNANGGAINNNNNSVITNIESDFLGNYTKTNQIARGGAISNWGYIENLIGNMNGNYAESAGTGVQGGAISNIYSNSNSKGIDLISGNYSGNHALATGNGYAYGGAIYNTNRIGEILNSNFTNNYAKSENGEAKGGAIYTTKDIKIAANEGFSSTFEGNYVEDKGGKRSEAIYADDNATITLDAQTNGKIIFNDKINGKAQYNLKLQGDSSGEVYFNNDIKNANIEHNDVTTTVKDYNFLNHAEGEGINSLTMNSGTLNLGSFALAPLHFETFGMNGGIININSVDVDLANKTMSRITANNYTGEGKGTINVKSMNILSDAEEFITPVKFADKSFKNTVHSDNRMKTDILYLNDMKNLNLHLSQHLTAAEQNRLLLQQTSIRQYSQHL